MYIKFYDRERELELLERVLDGRGTRFVVVKGIRRIGKTRTVLEAIKRKKKDYIYIFVPKGKSEDIFLEELSLDLGIPRFTSLRDLFLYLFEKYEVVFIDEFQNFYYMKKSVYSDLQKIIDEFRRGGRNLCIIVTGSSYSLMKKIFSEYSRALYGRRDLEINLDELPENSVFEMLSDIGFKNFEEKFKIWSIFGGIPKFYETLFNLRISSFGEFFDIFFLQNFRILLDEGEAILRSEFGGEFKSFYTAMEAISLGKTKLREIATVFANDINRANRYLSLLVKEYNLVKKVFPLVGNKRNCRYEIKNNFFDFWFSFVKRYEYQYEQGNMDFIVEKFNERFNSYLGKKFEKLCEKIIRIRFPKFKIIGKQWGKIPGKKDVYEIDIVALNEKAKEVMFCECKWKENVDPLKIVRELENKTDYFLWKKGERKEYFCIFAKSFKRKIEEFEGRKVFCLDLRDIEEVLSWNISNSKT